MKNVIQRQTPLPGYEGLTAFAGDLHNHCGISYGHGTIEDAFQNARLQLDFASVTGHASWHDMPADPRHVAEYHRAGFRNLQQSWEHVQDVTELAHKDGEFVSFLSFEWHSMTYGDHCVYYRAPRGPLGPSQATSIQELRSNLRILSQSGLPTMVLPHHVGYQSGHRGINWDTFTEDLSPVVELVSMHGSGEVDNSPRPYLHTMGARDLRSTAQWGLARGHRFGFIGSTDHHSAHPGSHGYGLAMVWAKDLTREAIWEAIVARRTYAATGNRIMVSTSVNGAVMGQIVEAKSQVREIDVAVEGGSFLENVELLRNGEIIATQAPKLEKPLADFQGIVSIALGWGEVGVYIDWNVEIELAGGSFDALEPRLRGYDKVEPLPAGREIFDHESGVPESHSFSSWSQTAENKVTLVTRTYGNPTTRTDATQGFAFHVTAPLSAELIVRTHGQEFRHRIGELLSGASTHYIGGFLSGVVLFERATPSTASSIRWQTSDEGSGNFADTYYVRVKQVNDQFAWSSPTWVEDPSLRGTQNS